MPKQRVAVLGAGPMGLSAAYHLTRRGFAPVVFEADDRIGGMSATFDFDGLELERYYHFHCLQDLDLIRHLELLGVADKLIWKRSKMGFFYRGRAHPWGTARALLAFPGVSVVAKLRYGLHAAIALARNNWHPLDSISGVTWIKRWIGSEAFDVWWRRLFELKFYSYADSVSAAWIWNRIKRMGGSRRNGSLVVGYIEGGLGTVLNPLANYIQQHGGELRLSHPISRIEIEHNRVVGVRSASGELLPFDKVVSTVPIKLLTKLAPNLPSQYATMIDNQHSIGIVCVVAKLRRSVSEYFWLNTNDDEIDVPGIIEYSNLRPFDGNIVYLPFYLPIDHPKFAEPDEVFISKSVRLIQKINPEITASDFLAIRCSRYQQAQFIGSLNFLETLPPIQPGVSGLWAADTSYYYPNDRGMSESFEFGERLAHAVAADAS